MSERAPDPWRPLRLLAYGLAVASLGCLLVGSLATDRFLWSQWIWWIPRVVLTLTSMPALVALALAPACPQRRWFRRAGGIACAVPLGAVLVSDIGWRRWETSPPGIHVIHWNASWPSSAAGADPSAALLERGADLVIVSNPYKLLGDGRDELWQAAGYEILRSERFLLASRWPVLEFRAVSDVEDRVLARARCEIDGRPFRIAMVDLPSDARLGRRSLAAAFDADTDLPTRDEVELVVGDFNITRGSESIRLLFPGFRHAFDEAGCGVGATWPRRLPLLHLDHMLLGADVRCERYRTLNLGTRVHRAQEAILNLD